MVLLAGCSSEGSAGRPNGGTDKQPFSTATVAPSSSAPPSQAPTAPAYEVIDRAETGLGSELTVSVRTGKGLRGVFDQIVADEGGDGDLTVTIVCFDKPDVRSNGYLLYGTVFDGQPEVSGGSGEPCPS